MRSTVTVSPTGCICPRSFVDGSSGTWATRKTLVRRPLLSRIRSSNEWRCSTNRPIGSGASSPMASTAPPRACTHSFPEHASATVSATHLPSSRRNWRRLRHLSVWHYARNSTRCCTWRASARACGCLLWGNGQSSPQHPLHPCGMKPTLGGGDDLEEQDLLPGGEP
jgi:hypothetical protein